MPVIWRSFSGAQVGASTRRDPAAQWLGHTGFEGRVQQPATGFSKSGSREVNLTASLISGGKEPRGQVLIFSPAQQFSRWGSRPQEQRSDAGVGTRYPWRAIRRCVNDTEEFGSRPESGLLQRCVTHRRDTARASYPVSSLRPRFSLGINFKDLTQYCSFRNHQGQTFASNVGASVAEIGALLAVQ